MLLVTILFIIFVGNLKDNIMKEVDIRGFEDYYTIREDGRVFSKRKGVYLKPLTNNVGYLKVTLSRFGRGKQYGLGPLVLENFDCERLPGLECHHIDGDKLNNHISNLKWVTHSQNCLYSYADTDRVSSLVGHGGRWFTEEVRGRMAAAKYKPIRAICGDEEINFESIQAVIDYFGTYREKVYRRLRSGKDLDGWFLEYA